MARALSVVGAGVLLIGVACLLVLAVQHGFFGPVPRVVSGGVLAVGLVVLGAHLHRRQPGNAGAVALAASGVVAAFLDVVACTLVYGWLGTVPGLLVAAAVFAVALTLAGWWRSQLLAVVATVAVAVLAPVVGRDQPWTATAFLVLVSAVTALTLGDRPWPTLHLVRIAATGVVVIGTAVAYADETALRPTVLVALALLHAVATLAAESRRDRRGEHRSPAWLGAAAALPALVTVLVATSGATTYGCLAVLAAVLLGSAILARTTAFRSVTVVALAVVALAGVDRLPAELWFPATTVVGAAFLLVGRSAVLARNPRLVAVTTWTAGGIGGLGLLGSMALLPGLAGSGPSTQVVLAQALATLGWLLIAGRMLRRTSGPTGVALLVAGLAVTKLVLVDLSTLDGLVRVLVFVVAGALLLALGVRQGRLDSVS